MSVVPLLQEECLTAEALQRGVRHSCFPQPCFSVLLLHTCSIAALVLVLVTASPHHDMHQSSTAGIARPADHRLL